MEVLDFLELDKKITLLDVRSPTEFQKGHIPLAINYPLFNDVERSIVGTTYKQNGKREAVLKGLNFIGKDLASFAEGLLKLSNGNGLVLHCWRGGMRSESVAWLSKTVGIETKVLRGGYKNYRRFIKEYMDQTPWKIKILGGPTGSKKTILLNQLKESGEQIIDLEKIAQHKGSAFGFLGQENQPTVEQFENNLFDALWKLNPSKTVWIENESKSIGRVYIPDEFWRKMDVAPIIYIHFSKEDRIQFLVKEYSQFGRQALAAAFEKIVKRLGGQHLKQALAYLEDDNFKDAAEIALTYYDKAYANSMAKQKGKIERTILASGKTIEEITKEIII